MPEGAVEITEVGGLQYPTMKFVVHPSCDMMALLLPNCTPEAEAVVFENIPAALVDRMRTEGISDAVPTFMFEEVARKVVLAVVSSGKVVWDGAKNKWVKSGA